MRVLVVANYQHGFYAPFIIEQVNALIEEGVEIDYFPVIAKGIKGYLKLREPLIRKISEYQPDIIHAHYGLSCLLANLQRKVPVVSTYHGSDINKSKNRLISKFAMLLSAHNIFVSEKNIQLAKPKKNYSLIPCGVDRRLFYKQDREVCRNYFNFNNNKKYILFSKGFHVKVKNYPLAKKAVDSIVNAELVELKGYSREEVAMLMNACDVALMTSFSEGSPQFIKEAIACGCPIVSTDVGDVKEIAEKCNSIFVTSYKIDDVIDKVYRAILMSRDDRYMLDEKFDNKLIALKIKNIYNKILSNNV